MSTYNDQTTQVMAMTWNVTEHMIFRRSLAVICSFSHCKDSTRATHEDAAGEDLLPHLDEPCPKHPKLLSQHLNQAAGDGRRLGLT